jgi:hypothetical protein
VSHSLFIAIKPKAKKKKISRGSHVDIFTATMKPYFLDIYQYAVYLL